MPYKKYSDYTGVENLSDHGAVVGTNTEAARDANNAAFTAAILAAKRTDTTYNESGGVYIPPGDYYIDETISIDGHWGLKLYGHGRGARILWRGGNSPAVKMTNSRECTLSHLIVKGQDTGIGIQLARTAGATVVAHHNTLEQVEIENFTDCVTIGGSGAVDANNDFHEFNHCTFRDFQRYAIDLSSNASQAYGITFANCMGWGISGTSQAIVYTGIGGGSFDWQGGGGFGCAADFLIGRHYQPHSIRRFVGEGSGRFLEATADNFLDVLIESCRWAGNEINADLTAIKVDAVEVARLSVRNSIIGDGNAPTVGTLIKFAPTNADTTLSGFEFVNNRVVSDAQNVFSGRAPTSKSGNIQITDETNLTMIAL